MSCERSGSIRRLLIVLTPVCLSCASVGTGSTPASTEAVTCTSDTNDHRDSLAELLTSSDEHMLDWKSKVGLLDANPDGLTVVRDDALCNAIWWAVWKRPPPPSDIASVTFFRLEDVYIVTNYINNLQTTGWNFTSVVSDQLELVNGTLAR